MKLLLPFIYRKLYHTGAQRSNERATYMKFSRIFTSQKFCPTKSLFDHWEDVAPHIPPEVSLLITGGEWDNIWKGRIEKTRKGVHVVVSERTKGVISRTTRHHTLLTPFTLRSDWLLLSNFRLHAWFDQSLTGLSEIFMHQFYKK